MPEPVNKKLYNRIKARIKAERGRWSARKSERLVLEYKKAGGKYRGSKSNSKLRKWRRKEWKAISASGKIVGPCGAKRAKGGKVLRCLPKGKAQSLTRAERAATARKKMRSRKGVVSNTKKARVRR